VPEVALAVVAMGVATLAQADMVELAPMAVAQERVQEEVRTVSLAVSVLAKIAQHVVSAVEVEGEQGLSHMSAPARAAMRRRRLINT